jgi:hypothetical protein
MPLRHIVGYLYLAFAVVLFLGTIGAVFAMAQNTRMLFPVSSMLEDFGMAVAGVVVGILLLRRKDRHWLWLALLVAVLGLFRFFYVRMLLRGLAPRMDIFFHGPLWVMLMDLATRVMLPVMFVLTLVLLFQREPETVPVATVSERRRPLFGTLSLVLPLLGYPLAYMMAEGASHGGEGGGALAAAILVAGLSFIGGSVSVMVAFIRWEKREFLPLLGFIVSTVPFFWLRSFQLSLGTIGPLIFGILFCAGFAIASMVTKERGRNWALLAAIPSGFVLASIVQPIIQALLMQTFRR